MKIIHMITIPPPFVHGGMCNCDKCTSVRKKRGIVKPYLPRRGNTQNEKR